MDEAYITRDSGHKGANRGEEEADKKGTDVDKQQYNNENSNRNDHKIRKTSRGQ